MPLNVFCLALTYMDENHQAIIKIVSFVFYINLFGYCYGY